MDKPVAGLIKDLKRRGLAGPDPGRLGRRVRPHPHVREGQRPRPQPLRLHDVDGRRRHQAGITVGRTDEVGLHAIEDRLHVHDLHATILHCLGADHSKLIYRHQGRPERPTVNEGQVCRKLLA